MSEASGLRTAAAALQGQRVLLTGATGLVGQGVLRALAGSGAQVVALVRASTTPAALPAGVERIAVPSYAATVVRDALRGLRVDRVLHLGAYGVKPDERDALAMVDGNVGSTAALLEALAPAPPQRFVFAGSSSQYTPRAAPALLDEDSPQQPANLYGACKLAAEQVGRAQAAQHGISFVSARLFGVYGPGEAPHRMIPYLVRTLARGEVPELTAGAQVRDWIYVDDVVEALLLAATAPRVAATWNVCSGRGVAVRDVARAVGAVMGREDAQLGLGRRPYRADEAMWVVGSPARLQADTGFLARTSLEEGVRRTVASCLEAGGGRP